MSQIQPAACALAPGFGGDRAVGGDRNLNGQRPVVEQHVGAVDEGDVADEQGGVAGAIEEEVAGNRAAGAGVHRGDAAVCRALVPR